MPLRNEYKFLSTQFFQSNRLYDASPITLSDRLNLNCQPVQGSAFCLQTELLTHAQDY